MEYPLLSFIFLLLLHYGTLLSVLFLESVNDIGCRKSLSHLHEVEDLRVIIVTMLGTELFAHDIE